MLRCHFCGNKLSIAQAMELHEGEGYFYVCKNCALSLDPLKLRQVICYRCAKEGQKNRSIAKCSICGKGICTKHLVDVHPKKQTLVKPRLSKYEPALTSIRSKRQILCDLCATAITEEQENE